MSVIIRLQNLPWSANALDIRTFFRGLSIPDGGVHIVGGEMGDAFIAFSTDEDARQAMMLDGKKLKEVQIKLLLSSRAEMQKVIETARQSSMNMLQIPAGQKSSQSYKSAQSSSSAQASSVTSSSLGNALPQQSSATLNINENSSQSYQSNMALLSQNENSADSRESRIDSAQVSRYKKLQINDLHRNYSRSHSRSRSSSRSRTRDRRRSRSRDRDRNTRRRERSRSRSIDRHDKRRRSSSQENSRDRDYENSREGIKRLTDIKVVQPVELNTYSEKPNLGSITQKNDMIDAKPNPMSVWNLAAKMPQAPATYASPSSANSFPTSLTQLQSMGQYNFAAFATMMPPHLQQQQFLLNQTQNSQMNQFGMQSTQKQMQKENQFTFPLNQMHGMNDPQQLQNPMSIANANNPMIQKPDDNRNQMIYGYNMQQLNSRNMPKLINEPGNLHNQREKVFDSQISDLTESKRSRNSPRRDNRDHRRRSRSPGRNHSPPNYSKRSRDPRDRGDVNYDAIEGNCIKISNMCPSTSYSELRRFFTGLHIANNGIKMINDDNGERVGVAYIQFVKRDSKPKAFIRNNAVFKKQRVVIESVTEDEFDQAIDSFKPERQQSFPSRHERSPTKAESEKRGNKGSPKNLDMDLGEENKRQEFSCLFLQDLPPFAKEQDIIKMFSSYVLFDILLTREKDNRRQYVCYVKFHRPEDAKNALEDSSKHKIAHKHIIISQCSDEDFEKAKEKYTTREESISDQQEQKENDHKMQGSDNNLSPHRTEIPDVTMTDSFGIPKKEDNNLNMQGVMQNMTQISNPFNKDPRQPMTAPSDPRRRGTRFSRPEDNKNKTKFAILRNCDYKATEKDFENFFADIGTIPNRIHILTNNRHQPTGECIIEFLSTEDAEKSLFKNNAIFGSRTVRVELITEKNVTDRLNENFIETNVAPTIPEEHIQIQPPESVSFDRAIQDQIINYICSQYGNDILSTQVNPQPEQQMDILPNIPDENIIQEETGPRSNPFRSNNNNMLNMNNKERGNVNQGQGNTRRHGRPSRFSDADNGMNKNRHPGNNNNRQHPIAVPELNNSTVDTFGKPGCVVGLENVPFKADTNDILEFFRDFNIHPRNVIRRYNDDGTPTGDARVAFSSPMEARAAIEQRRLHKIFNRTIYLALV